MSEALLSSPTMSGALLSLSTLLDRLFKRLGKTVREYCFEVQSGAKSIIQECFAVEPEEFDKMICSKISAWESFGEYKSSKDKKVEDKYDKIISGKRGFVGDK